MEKSSGGHGVLHTIALQVPLDRACEELPSDTWTLISHWEIFCWKTGEMWRSVIANKREESVICVSPYPLRHITVTCDPAAIWCACLYWCQIPVVRVVCVIYTCGALNNNYLMFFSYSFLRQHEWEKNLDVRGTQNFSSRGFRLYAEINRCFKTQCKYPWKFSTWKFVAQNVA